MKSIEFRMFFDDKGNNGIVVDRRMIFVYNMIFLP